MTPSDKDDMTPRVEAWAEGGTDTSANVPDYGIGYSKQVTVNSAAKSRGTEAEVASSERENDAVSQEWIMDT